MRSRALRSGYWHYWPLMESVGVVNHDKGRPVEIYDINEAITLT